MASSDGQRYDVGVDVDGETSHGKLIRYTGRGKRVLDLGCAAGAVARVLVENDCKVWGVDVDAAAAKLAQSVCEHVVVGDLDELDLELAFEGMQFDVVLAGDVLEHLRDPVRLLKQVVTMIAPGGHLVASVPNVAHASVRMALLHGEFPRSDRGLLDDTHLQFLTRDQFLAMLTSGGFTSVFLDATLLAPEDSEVRFADDALTRQVLPLVADDPTSLVYQHVAIAAPRSEQDLEPLDALTRYLEHELEATRASRAHERREAHKLEGRSAALAAQVADLELLLKVKELNRVDLDLHHGRELDRLNRHLVHIDALHKRAELNLAEANLELEEILNAPPPEPPPVVLPTISSLVVHKLVDALRRGYRSRQTTDGAS